MVLNEAESKKGMQALAREVFNFVRSNSAGEMGRRVNWESFVKSLPQDYNLMELSDECVYAMSDDQKRQFLAKHLTRGEN